MKNITFTETYQWRQKSLAEQQKDVMFRKTSFYEVLIILSSIQDEAIRLGYEPNDPKVEDLLQTSLTANGWTSDEYVSALKNYENRLRDERLEQEKKNPGRKN